MSEQPIVILGANGQIGSALCAIAEQEVVLFGREQADLSKPDSLPGVIEAIQPSAIINAAAYTQVDKAEEEEALATVINGEAPGVLAAVAGRLGIPLVHYSTDYVYDGSGTEPRNEETPVKPLNAYGRSKLAGEEAVQEVEGQFLILRTSWVYDAYRKNFLTTMLKLGEHHETLRVVVDQVGAPSYAMHLAAATFHILQQAQQMEVFPSGIYHLANRGEISWHGFAEAIFAEARAREMELRVKSVQPIASEEYPTPAKRPRNSRLDMRKVEETFHLQMPRWSAGLKDAMNAIAGEPRR